VGDENLNPLDELKRLDQQVGLVASLEGLKPIYYRLDEIAKQYANDFEVQLVVGDIKQHLVNRGTKLKEQETNISAASASASRNDRSTDENHLAAATAAATHFVAIGCSIGAAILFAAALLDQAALPHPASHA
jgi:hypothetical protein